ncbi:MAG TPA: ABC transporter permease, partial [Saprospiraceae bacterium]|nr:ABC transporter permease [Saprospiraceae bacterium]
SLPIDITWSNWYNLLLVYSTFMVPGILVLLVTMVAVFLTAINIVREKEMGTIEQLNVTPVKKYQFIIGKLFPFLIIAFFELSIGLVIAKLVFNLNYQGSILLVYAFTLVYLFAVLSIGLFISTVTHTQQQAMFIAWFIMVIFILMSGLFTPVESMPGWAQKVTWFNPIKYFIEFMRMVLLKGSTFSDVKTHFIIIAVYGLVLNRLAVWNYKKVSG